MTLQIVGGTANRALADSVAEVLGNEPVPVTVERFPEGELRPAVDGLRGADVSLIQPTGPPVNEHVMELPLLIDTCRRAGAAPQSRRTSGMPVRTVVAGPDMPSGFALLPRRLLRSGRGA